LSQVGLGLGRAESTHA